MIGRYPRYRELWERYRATVDRPEGAGLVLSSPAILPTCKCCRSWHGSTNFS